MQSGTELNGPINQANDMPKQLVFFLHGWGSDGNDLIQISHHWKNEMPNTTFLAPNGPEVCSGNPQGRQWFNILTDSNEIINVGLNNAFILLDKYIQVHLNTYKLQKDNFFLVGFSQGAMLALFTSLRKKCKGIIGYSGAFLEKEIPKNFKKNDVLLVHGQKDNVVPIARMKSAEKKLITLSSSIETQVYKDLEHSINEEGLALGSAFIKKRF